MPDAVRWASQVPAGCLGGLAEFAGFRPENVQRRAGTDARLGRHAGLLSILLGAISVPSSSASRTTWPSYRLLHIKSGLLRLSRRFVISLSPLGHVGCVTLV